MDPATMGLIGAGVSAASSFFGQQSANDANIQLAGENRAWQEQMSNTAHQREVADLQAAGLNPMLSALKGGASTPQGAVARVESSTKDAVNSGATASLLAATIEKLKAEAKAADAAAYSQTSAGDERYGLTEPSQSTIGLQGHQGNELMDRQLVHVNTVRHLTAQIEQLHEQGKLTQAQVQEAKQRIGESSARELEHVIHTMHLDLDLPRARNEAATQTTWWKKNVAPYLKDAGTAVGTGATLAGGMALGRRMSPYAGGGAQGLRSGGGQGLRPPVSTGSVVHP